MIAQLLINVWNSLALKTLFFRIVISRRIFVIFLLVRLWKTAKNERNTYHLATSITFFLAVSLIAPIHEQEYKKLGFTKPAAIPIFSLI